MKNNNDKKAPSTPMSSHDYAKHLLSKEDKPMYIEKYVYINGDDVKMYSQITGLKEDKIEDAYLIEEVMTSDKINDIYFNFGDGLVKLNDKEIYVSVQDLIYMLFNDEAIYESNIKEAIGFTENKESLLSDIQKLKSEIKISLNESFHPEQKSFSLKEAKKWYENNFNDLVKKLQ